MFLLEALNTAQKGKQIPLRGELRIGRAEDCHIKAVHPELEDQHARFLSSPTGLEVEVGSKAAHIYVNNRDVLHSELKHNDVVRVGPLRFKVIDQRIKQRTESRLDELLETLGQDSDEEVHDFATEDLFYLTTKDPTLRQAIAFRIPSRDRFIDQCQQFLARLVKQCGMDEMKVEAFMTCTKELILNAHRHGHQYDESKSILIRYRDDGEAVTLVIEDQGPGFDHSSILGSVQGKSAADAARERYKAGGFGGLGFQMITRMADEIFYNEPGNVVTFTIKKEFA